MPSFAVISGIVIVVALISVFVFMNNKEVPNNEIHHVNGKTYGPGEKFNAWPFQKVKKINLDPIQSDLTITEAENAESVISDLLMTLTMGLSEDGNKAKEVMDKYGSKSREDLQADCLSLAADAVKAQVKTMDTRKLKYGFMDVSIELSQAIDTVLNKIGMQILRFDLKKVEVENCEEEL